MEEDLKYIEHMIKNIDFNNLGYVYGNQSLENLTKRCIALEENLKIATAMLTRGTYPEKNKGDNDFEKQFISVEKIKALKKENEKKIDDLRPYKHQCPFDFGILNGIDECCRTLLGENLKIK